MNHDKQFEILVGELYRRKGYRVELQKTIVGKSGAEHKFDGYCEKGHFSKKVLTFETKYSTNGLPVRIDDFSRFLTAVDDCCIPEGHMITNSYFSDNILNLALTYNIKLIDGKQLRKELRKYRMDSVISNTNELLNSFAIPIAKLVLDSVDGSKTLSRILLPRDQNRVLHLDLNLYSSLSQSMNLKNQSFLDSTQISYEVKNRTHIEDLILVEKPKVSFSDIGGLQEVKEKLKVAITYRTVYKDLYKKFEVEPASVLLYGPPGCGKTLLAKAVAAEINGKFIAPKISDVIKRYSGDSLAIISSIFNHANDENENSVIFLDELDVYMKRIGSPYDIRIKNEFLQQMDGVTSEKENFSILGATNKPWLLDPAIRRPGRFDEKIFVPPPDYEARKETLRIYMKDLVSKQMISEVDSLVESLASRTEGWSGADLKRLVETSKTRGLLDIIKGNQKTKLTLKDFEKIIEKSKPSTNAWFFEAVRACKRYGEEDLLEEILKHYPKLNRTLF